MVKDKKVQYDDSFYADQMAGSYRSAVEFAAYLSQFIKPESVVDMGCGRGTWLKAFHEAGAKEVAGYDGVWNSQDNMTIPAIKFIGTDLNQPAIDSSKSYDLAISLEVAEHLRPENSEKFVAALTDLSDTVMFSGAYLLQGGTDHINERLHSFWANLFLEKGYAPFDIFRPHFWGNDNIEYWYQQNVFLYVKRGSALEQKLQAMNHREITNLNFMNCIHPRLYDYKITDLRFGKLMKKYRNILTGK